MRIALASLYLPGSSKIGVGYQVHQLANKLVDRGHSVTVFSPDSAGDGARYQLRHVDPGDSLRTFRFAWRLRGVDFGQFDVFHGHGDDCFLIGRRRPPHLRTVHGSCFSEARRVPETKEKIRMVLLGAEELLSMAVADRCVAVSEATTRLYPWIDTVVPCGVDTNRFGVDPRRTREEVPTILFVGTYRNRKRGKLLAEVFTRTVRKALPDARLWMVCDDAPGGQGIDVLGRLSDDDLAERYQRAWVFCLPSSYEGFGVPYIEAMAAGCPVVSTPNPGATEVLAGGKFGRIVDVDRLGGELVELLRDDHSRAEMAWRGHERAQRYDWAEVVAAYENIYESLLAREPGIQRAS
jgi:glycosyltransferase involved in cell wall biosynthesis